MLSQGAVSHGDGHDMMERVQEESYPRELPEIGVVHGLVQSPCLMDQGQGKLSVVILTIFSTIL